MKAYELLAPEGAWTQRAQARDERGCEVPFSSPFAVSYCLLGALYKCYPSTRQVRDSLYDRLKNTPGFDWTKGFPGWNDAPDRTQAEVVALLKELDI